MAITLTLDTHLAYKVVRKDIVENLGYDGIERIIEWYDDLGNDIEFDQSLFWCWHRYSNAIEAVTDHDSSAFEELTEHLKDTLDEGEHLTEEMVEDACAEWLENNCTIITLRSGEVIVNTDC